MVFFLDFIGRFHRGNNQEETITPGVLLIPSRRLCSSLAGSPEVLSLSSPHSLVSDSPLLHASSFSMNYDWCLRARVCVHAKPLSIFPQACTGRAPAHYSTGREHPSTRALRKNRGFLILQCIFTEIHFTFNFII